VEVFLVVAFASIAAWLFTSERLTPELAALQTRYGPSRSSLGPEEWIIRDFFGDRRGGVFLDVGASHYRNHSNTYYLETALGWSGIAVEPLQTFASDYAQHRPRTKFRPFFVSDVSQEQAKLYFLSENAGVTSANKAFTDRYGKGAQEISATTITLNDLLTAEGVEAVDFMSMDIELSEPKALAGFDIKKYRPELVGIEAHPEVRQQILDYFARNGYVLLGRYLRADYNNLWFTPLAHPSEARN
jgi:FkbM family methyltransferase